MTDWIRRARDKVASNVVLTLGEGLTAKIGQRKESQGKRGDANILRESWTSLWTCPTNVWNWGASVQKREHRELYVEKVVTEVVWLAEFTTDYGIEIEVWGTED